MRHTSPKSLTDYPRTVSYRSIAQLLTASISEVQLRYISRVQRLTAGTDVSKGSATAILQHLPWCRFVTLNMEATHFSVNIVAQPKVNFIGQIFQTNGTFCGVARFVLNWLKTLVILNCGSNCSCTDCTLTNIQYSPTHIMMQQPILTEVKKAVNYVYFQHHHLLLHFTWPLSRDAGCLSDSTFPYRFSSNLCRMF